jgi:hypothetical protein
MVRRKKSTKVRKTPFVLMLFFIALGSLGIALNEPGRVLELALQVCLSCIGIG